tara:strand:- start:40 stop:735 length:696 start_codon:yes stop_codon:yes gene_type:complete
MFKRLVAVAVLSVASFSASAEFVHADWNGKSGNVSYDTETKTAWLKFNETRTYSIETVIDLTKDGGSLEGWRLPTPEEVYAMWEGFMGGPTAAYNRNNDWILNGSYGVTEQGFNNFREFMGGGNWGSKGYYYGRGYFISDTENNTSSVAGFVAKEDGYGHYFSPYPSTPSRGDNYSGIFLVNDGDRVDISFNGNLVELKPKETPNDVPTPLVGLSLLSLLYITRKKKESNN